MSAKITEVEYGTITVQTYMKITIITVGNKPNSPAQQLIYDWEKRLSRHIQLSWHFIPHAKGDTKAAVRSESIMLSSKIPDKSFVILLDERGSQLSSPNFSELLFSANKDIIFIIGGAYGVDDSIRNRADYIWSLSKLVFPHELVRLLLIEQLYRADCIQRGHPYHHD